MHRSSAICPSVTFQTRSLLTPFLFVLKISLVFYCFLKTLFSEVLTNVKGEEEESDESGAKDKYHIRRDGSGGKKPLF